ncbi:cytochrome c oxidase subunit II [Ramlibacter sp. XY19]|uniref:cytochrome c oxidase subunit II n=1 Tax=Ramlibacter paludis TaxID=2908000 RepID=UPI0023DA6BED|nr:cytochrome c oxidase subunit II [Ramlibacter paludis]MCG2591204.1 cytochrome c oxidase subunit II [Ramlibacter paludis]
MNPGLHDALQAMGPQAAHFIDLWHIFLLVCTLVFGAVLAGLLLALRRAPRVDTPVPPDLSTVNQPEPGPRRGVVAAVTASVLLLLALLVASVFTDRAMQRLSLADAVQIEITGHQWWWTIKYLGDPDQTFVTANEIHVPVGRPVIVQLKSEDVIHSLWVPSLAGKKDLIPGRTAVMTFRADQPGVYRGQCAEFCGLQHAFMAFNVQAESPAQFEAWRQQQLAAAPAPTDAQALRGQAVFQAASCAMCHSVAGTLAGAKHAPDLSHVASRQTLAAGTLPNTPAHLAAWIADPQKFKPGTNMPATPLAAADLAALVAYLGTLK